MHTRKHALKSVPHTATNSKGNADQGKQNICNNDFKPVRSPHILSVSSSLMGICLIMITSLRVFGKAEKTIVDEITAVAALIFMASCMLSFLSIRKPGKMSRKMEDIADFIFLAGLSLLFIATILLSFNIIH